jgi:hypothetical protein
MRGKGARRRKAAWHGSLGLQSGGNDVVLRSVKASKGTGPALTTGQGALSWD